MKQLYNLSFLLILATCFIQQPVQSKSFITKIFDSLSSFNKKNREQLNEVFDNFYEVEKNAFYRSQQLSPTKLEDYIKKYGIKTVINLRGDNDKTWWQEEKAITEKNGASFFSIAMSAVLLTKKEDLVTLLQLYETAPRPILVHCLGGADRTGEAAALWVLDQQGKGKEQALEQLSIKYGHRKYKNSAKDLLIEIVKIEEGRIKKWIETSYDHTHYSKK